MARPPTLTRTGFPYAIDDRTQLGQTRQIRLHRVEGIPAIESDEDFRMPRRHNLYGASRVDVSFGQAQCGYQGVSRFLRQRRRELDRTRCVIAIPRPSTNATWPRRSRGPNASAADADSDWFRSLQVRNAPVAACAPLHPSKRAGVMPQMVFDEALHEPVAVIVARLQAQRERLPGVTARLFEQLGTQLFAQESVGVTLVDQDGAVEAFARANQCAGIVRVPCIAVVAEIARQCLVSPRHLCGRDDR